MLATWLAGLVLATTARANLQFYGIAMAGGDFGCQIDGSCPTGQVQLPLSSLGGGDGAGQMKHFVQDDGMNVFRLPISWQFLVNNNVAGSLNAGNLAKYDQLVQACLATGASCIIDIHNFARFNGGIIGQGGPTDDQFVSLWTQLATKYAATPKIIFEVMNEPHDLDVGIWAATCQKVVTAIRGAGATSQMILLPGTNFDSAATLVSSGSAAAVLGIKNPDGSTDNLLLDIHKYLDIDNSGTHAACITDNVGNFTIVADFLRQNKRLGFVSETGASSDASCLQNFCTQNAFIVANSDVFVGLVGWAAGSFGSSYVLSMTPSKSNGRLVDNQLCSQCLVGVVMKGSGSSPNPPSSNSASVSSPSQTTTQAVTPSASGGIVSNSVASSSSPPKSDSVSVSGSASPTVTRGPGVSGTFTTATTFLPSQTVSQSGGSRLGSGGWLVAGLMFAAIALNGAI